MNSKRVYAVTVLVLILSLFFLETLWAWQIGEPPITDIKYIKCGGCCGENDYRNLCYYYNGLVDPCPFTYGDGWKVHPGIPDFNLGTTEYCGGYDDDDDQIVICYKRDPDQDPITELLIAYNSSCPSGFETAVDNWGRGDLNATARGADIYLCFKRDWGPPVTDLFLAGCPYHMPPCRDDGISWPDGGWVRLYTDLNGGACGWYLGLCYQREDAAVGQYAWRSLGLNDAFAWRDPADTGRVLSYGYLTSISGDPYYDPYIGVYGGEGIVNGVFLNPLRGETIITTGIGNDRGLGSTDHGDDGVPDEVYYRMDMTAPADATHLNFTTQFITSEIDESGTKRNNDWAEYQLNRYMKPPALLPLADVERSSSRLGGSVETSIDLQDLSTVSRDIQVDFRIHDRGDGLGDSALRISDVYFTFTDPIKTVTERLKSSLSMVAHDTEELSWDQYSTSPDGAGPGFRQGSIILSTGLAKDWGLGDTDLGSDNYPDQNGIKTKFHVPKSVNYLNFTTQFITSKRPGQPDFDQGWFSCLKADDTACCTLPDGSPCPAQFHRYTSYGASENLSTPEIYSLDVSSLQNQTIYFEFAIQDVDIPLGDSALLLSDVYFSTDPASLVNSQKLSHSLGHHANEFGYPYIQIRDDSLYGSDTNRSVSADPGTGSILLSTGLATDGGTGTTELKAGQTDFTTYGMRLAVPEGAQSLRFTADFMTSEDSSSTPGDSFIILVDGRCLGYDAQGQCVPVFNSHANPSGTSIPVVLDLWNKKEVMVEFYITDESNNNQGDSAVIIKDFHFSPDLAPARALKILTDQMASELDQGKGYVADAWLYGTDPSVSASVGSEEGSIVLSTGLASDLGAGNTILGAAGKTDYTIFSLDLNVPLGAHTFSFTANFITSEDKNGEGDIFAIYIDGEPLGVVNSNNIGGQDEVGLRNRQADWSFYVKCKQKISVLFYITDEQADRGGDSAVIISNLRFSADPVPEVTAQSLVSALANVSAQVSDSWLSGPDPNWSALAIPSKGQIVLSTGRAIDFGLGSSDLCGTSIADEDYTRFGMKLSVPSGMKSLGYKTLLLTRSTGNADLFTVKKNGSTELEVLSTDSLQTNRKVERWMNVEGLIDEVTVEFQIADGVDGKNDFTAIISDVRFSGQDPLPPGYDPDDGVPPDEQTPVPPENAAGDPVDIAMGSYLYNKELIRVPGVGIPLSFSIHYNSASEWYGPVGNRWGHSYDWFIERPGEGVVVVRRGDAGADYFVKQDGAWVPKFGGVFTSLTEKAGGGFTYSTKLQMSCEFDASGNLTSISDAYGNTLSLIYEGGKLSKIVDTRGNSATLTYDGKGRLLSVFYDAGPLSQSVSFSHNEAGDLTGFTKVDGRTSTFIYDAEGRLLTGTRADGVTFITNLYDEKGRVTEQWDAKGASRLYEYGDGTVTLTDRRGNMQTKTFDILGRLIEWDVELEETTAAQNFTYDENSNRTSSTDPLGRVTEASYDVSGNMTEHTDALGNAMSMTPEDPLGLPTTTDRDGNTFKFEYDPLTRTRTVTDPLGGKQVSTYNPKGQILSITNQMGNMYTYAYTDKGDPASVTDPLGEVTRYEYDTLGRKISTTDPKGHKTTFTYDLAGRLLTRTNAAGQTTLYTYDANGRMLTRKEVNGAITQFTYTLTNKIASVTDPTGNVFTYEYDPEDKLLKRIDPMGHVTVFTYDKANRLISVTDAKSGKIEATYNEAGERLKLTDPNGNVTTYEYDSLGRIVSENDPVGNVVKNTYEARGLVSSVTNGRGQTIGHEYDGARRLTGIVLPDATAIKHTYDVSGNRVHTVGRDNSVIERQFDALNRLISRTDPFGNKVAYEYDKAGNLITLIYSDGKKVHYEYDRLNRLIRVTDWEGRVTEYTYNPAGKLQTAKLPDGSVVAYTFNLANQLTGIIDYSRKGKLNFSTELTLDKAGNPIRERSELPLHPEKHIRYEKLIFQVNAANQLIDPVKDSFSYDADGNMIRGPLSGELTELVYDELNQLIQAGADTYCYDADGLRIEATINGRTVRYVQDPNAALSRVLEEQDEKGQIIARYIYGVGLIGREEVRGHKKFSDYGKLSIYHFDSRGNTIALSDEHGHITDRYAYDPYGRLLGHHDADHDHHHAYDHGRHHDHHETNPFTFCGQFGVMDDGNGLYFMRTRYYAPGLMRFVQRDVLYRGTLYSTQSANRYGYTEGNPVLRSDPDGQFFWAFIAIGIAVGVASQVLQSAITGDWGEWYDWVGAVAGGAIGGAIGGGTVGLVSKWGISNAVTLAIAGGISGALGGMATSAISQGFGAIGGEGWDWTSFGISAAMGGVLGAFGGAGLKDVADDMAQCGNFLSLKNFFLDTGLMLKDAWQEELFVGLLEIEIAGALMSSTAYYGSPIPIVSDSLPVTDPTVPNSGPQNPIGGLKGDAN